jgi:hypothetical protein
MFSLPLTRGAARRSNRPTAWSCTTDGPPSPFALLSAVGYPLPLLAACGRALVGHHLRTRAHGRAVVPCSLCALYRRPYGSVGCSPAASRRRYDRGYSTTSGTGPRRMPFCSGAGGHVSSSGSACST